MPNIQTSDMSSQHDASFEPKPLSILILEECDDDAELLLRGLRRTGLEMVWRRVQSREGFLREISADLDLILADHSLPDFDAIEALKLLQERGLDVPLIVISGAIGEEAAVEALKHGAVDYLLKDRLGRLEGAIRRAQRERTLRLQRQEALDALRYSEKRYRKMVEDSLQGMVVIQDGRVVYANQAYAGIIGYSPEEIEAMSAQDTLELVHEEDQPVLLELYQKRMAGEESPVRYEFRITRKDGAIRWLDAFVTATVHDGRRAAQAFYVDVTERKQAEEAARQQEARERLEQILNAIGEGVLVLDRGGRVQQANPAFLRQTGYSEEEIAGARYEALWARNARGEEDFLQGALAEVTQGGSWRGQVKIRRRNGTSYDAAMTVTQLPDGRGLEQGLVVSIRDISQMKEVERLKDSIISIAAHELRTPLTTIGLYSEALATRELAAEQQRRYLNAVYEQTQALTAIIDDMLDLARLEAGRGLEPAAEPIDLGALVQEVLRPFAELEQRHEFGTEGLEEIHAVAGDPLRLAQVLRNIISNAVKYSPEGGPVLVSGRNVGDAVQISVTDAGMGLTAEQQRHLFEKFYRAHAMPRGARGTGLGLAICRLIVEGHGGQIWAESEQGVGSTFTFTIPAA